jgi:hypothetical protein
MFNHVSGLPALTPLTVRETDGRREYLLPSGRWVPSVTTILGHSKVDVLDEWRNRVGNDEAAKITRRAATRGTKFHEMVERYLTNRSVFENVMPDMRELFNNARSALDLITDIHYIEAQLYSEKLGTAGRTDVVGAYNRTLSIIDFKTSLKPKKEEWIQNYFEQASAYAFMYKELIGVLPKQIVVIIAVDNEPEPQVFVKNPHDYILSLYKKVKTYNKEFGYVS